MTFWDRMAGLYDLAETLNKKVYDEMLSITERMIPEYSTVLDVAAGTGELTMVACKKAERVVCSDLSLPMLRRARMKCRRKGYDNVIFDAGDINHLSYDDESFDVVIAGNVLHLIDDPKKGLDELYRVTKKGGKILVPTFTTSGATPLLKIYRLLGFNPSVEYTPFSYREMLMRNLGGDIRVKLIKGVIPCCYAVIRK